MSSPGQVPPSAPVPSYRHPRSMSGPIVLILIGVIFLLTNAGILHWDNFWHLFAHYWPLLLILMGVIRLFEYYHGQRTGQPTRGVGVGGAFLLIFLIMFGLAATHAARFDWEGLRGQFNVDDEDFSFFGHTYNYEDQMAQAFPPGASLHVNSDRGAVNINVSDDSQIKVVIHKRIHAESQYEADKWNGNTKPQITASESVVTLNANSQGAGDHSVTTDMDITIPKKANVVVTARRGDVSVLGRDGDVDVTSQKGELTISDIRGKLTLNLQGSSARLSNIASDVSVQGKVNDFSLADAKGAVHLDGEFMESVKLSKCARGVTFKSSRTEMTFTKLDGDLDLDSGDLRAGNMGGPVRLITRDKDIRLNAVNGELRLQNENGPLAIYISKLGNVQIDNKNATVELHVPDKAAFSLEARSRNGDIETDFNSLKVSSSDEVSTASGTVGGGGPRIVINNEHGNIEVRRGSVVAEAPPKPSEPPDSPVSDN